MEAPESPDAARELLAQFAIYQKVATRFAFSLTVGRDGKALPGWVKIGDYWQAAEADRHFAKACAAEGAVEADMTAMQTAEPEQMKAALRKAARLAQVNGKAMRLLEESISATYG